MMRVARMLAVYGVLLATALFTFSGCCRHRQTGLEFDLLHQELRQMEDYIYHLEDELAQRNGQPDPAIQSTDPVNQSDVSQELFPPGVLRETAETEANQADVDGGIVEGLIEVPGVKLGAEIDKFQAIKQSANQALLESRLSKPWDEQKIVTEAMPADGQFKRQVPQNHEVNKPINTHVTHIVFNQRMTGGTDMDGVPGDDGVTVVLEPRNTEGQFVPLAGPITVVVLDPQKKDEWARLVRRDFDDLEVSRLLFEEGPNSGIHLEVPWKEKFPTHSQLHLFARYETVDGRPLVTDQAITIDQSGEISSHWTPSTRFARQQRRQNNMRGQLVDDNIGRPAVPDELLIENQDQNLKSDRSRTTGRPPAPPSPISITDADFQNASKIPRRPSWSPYR